MIQRLYIVISRTDLILKSLDIMTVVIPPTLPVALSIGIFMSVFHLNIKDILCIDLERVVEGGQISCVCFDKTGTLSSADMVMTSFLPNVDSAF